MNCHEHQAVEMLSFCSTLFYDGDHINNTDHAIISYCNGRQTFFEDKGR